VGIYYDRFASTHPDDREFDTDAMAQGTTEYLGQLPDEHFEQAAHSAFAQAPPAQRQGLLSSLLGALQGRGVDLGGLQQQLGLLFCLKLCAICLNCVVVKWVGDS